MQEFDAPPIDGPSSGGSTGGYLSRKGKATEEAEAAMATGENFVAPAATGLLADLQRGPKNLKKASERKIEPKAVDARTGMLSEIRNRNVKLRHVDKTEVVCSPSSVCGAPVHSIAACRTRRKRHRRLLQRVV